MDITQIHHVAYRCRDARETVEFYSGLLGLNFSCAVSADFVPSIKTRCPYIHVFFELPDESNTAFFEVPEEKPMQKDPNTPEWIQHFAFQVPERAVLDEAKEKLEAAGIEVVGPTDHDFIESIYFFDPNGHRLELTVRTDVPGQMEAKKASAMAMLDDWDRRKANGFSDAAKA